MIGWLKIHRQLEQWEWYTDVAVFKLFMHLLLKANFEDNNWRGMKIKRGQLPTGRQELAAQTGLTEQQVRTALNKLASTSEITIKNHNKFSVITICKYESYQSGDEDINQQNNQRINQQTTTLKEEQEYKKNNISKTRARNSYPAEFEEFWRLYPPNAASKVKTHESWQKAINSGVEHGNIGRAAGGYRRYLERTGAEQGHVAHATTWLNQARWEVDYEPLGRTAGSNGSYVQGKAGTGRGQAQAGASIDERANAINKRLEARHKANNASRGLTNATGGGEDSKLLLENPTTVRKESG